MLETLCYISCVTIWIGLGIASTSKETSKKRQIGWIIIAIATFIDGISVLLQSRLMAGSIILAIAALDVWIFNYWRKRYNRSKLTNREKFLEEIMENKH